MKFNTIKEAAENWVREFDRIPMGVVEKLLGEDYGGVTEITPPSRYDRVELHSNISFQIHPNSCLRWAFLECFRAVLSDVADEISPVTRRISYTFVPSW